MARILVVDDEPWARQYLVTLLAHAGHETREAGNGEEGLAVALADPPDLIITDGQMPLMKGAELVRRIRGDIRVARTPIILNSAAHGESPLPPGLRECGVSALLPKASDPRRVLEVVDEVLCRHPPETSPGAEQCKVTMIATAVPSTEGMHSAPLRELQAVQNELDTLVAGAVEDPERRAAAERLAARLSTATAGISDVTVRLSALMEAGLALLQVRDPERLARHCFESACAVIGSRYAAFGILDPDGGCCRSILSKGIGEQVFRCERGARDIATVAACLERNQAFRFHTEVEMPLPGFPAAHPAVRSFLCVPVASAEKTYGWMYFANKDGAAGFSEEDERVASILALQFAMLHENFLLYDALSSHAGRLEREVAERLEAQRRLQEANEHLEESVAQRTAELQQANAELEAFSYSVSHDLRSPLNVITGFSSLLLRAESREPEPSGERRRFLQHIDSAAGRTLAIVDALMRLANLNRQPLLCAPIDVHAMVREVVDELKQLEPERRVDVRIEAMPGCTGDALMLKQVFANLLANAFKFTRTRTEARVCIGWKADAGAYFVADNGVGFGGVGPEVLFAPFKRGHSTAQFEGTGVGLSIVRRVIDRHGGRVWAESRRDEGATFFFSLGPPSS